MGICLHLAALAGSHPAMSPDQACAGRGALLPVNAAEHLAHSLPDRRGSVVRKPRAVEVPSAYRRGWRCAVAVFTGAGWLLAPLAVSRTSMVGVCVVALVLTLAFTVGDLQMRGVERPPSVTVLLSGLAILVAAMVMLDVTAGAAWPVVAGVLLTSPTVASYGFGLFVRPRTAVGASTDPAEREIADVSVMVTAEVVRAWRASFPLLARARTCAARAAIVTRRQQYLDELMRRDPDGVRRWLSSGASAAGDPEHFLH